MKKEKKSCKTVGQKNTFCLDILNFKKSCPEITLLEQKAGLISKTPPFSMEDFCSHSIYENK